eukprot:1483191-Amphidinium_carterae.1
MSVAACCLLAVYSNQVSLACIPVLDHLHYDFLATSNQVEAYLKFAVQLWLWHSAERFHHRHVNPVSVVPAMR